MLYWGYQLRSLKLELLNKLAIFQWNITKEKRLLRDITSSRGSSPKGTVPFSLTRKSGQSPRREYLYGTIRKDCND